MLKEVTYTMTSQIDLADKTERDILVLLVERVHGINERLDKQNGTINKQNDSITAHDTRLRSLENWRYLIVGGLGVLTLGVVVGIPLIVKYWAG